MTEAAQPVADTLTARHATYGHFQDNAAIAQGLKHYARLGLRWTDMTPSQREAVDMILSKVSRIVTGDPTYVDNWHDIQGYARLVERQLQGENP